MGKGKYVRGSLRTDSGPKEGAILFPEGMFHSDTKKLFYSITSAGFFQVTGVDEIGYPEINVYGRSESLNVDSQPYEDQFYILQAMGWA